MKIWMLTLYFKNENHFHDKRILRVVSLLEWAKEESREVIRITTEFVLFKIKCKFLFFLKGLIYVQDNRANMRSKIIKTEQSLKIVAPFKTILLKLHSILNQSV